MRDRSIYAVIAFVIVGVIALGTGFRKVPYERPDDNRAITAGTTSSTIESGGAEQVSVTLEQAVGELQLEGGTEGALMEADFDTHPSSWMPDVDYSVDGTQGALSVRQAEDSARPFDRARNTWRISLDESMPIDLTVKTGVGESDLDLRDIALTRLRVTTGVGEARIDLSDERATALDVELESGVGEVTVVVPRDTPVRIVAETGVGEFSAQGFRRDGRDWVNSAYYAGGAGIEMRIHQGIGEVRVETAP